MENKNLIKFILLALIVLGIIYIIPRKEQFKAPPSPGPTPHVDSQNKQNSRRVIGSPAQTNSPNTPQDSRDTPPEEELIPDNTPSEDWQEYLEENIRKQGGSSIESIDIKKTESVIIKRDNRNLAAESVVITLTKPDGSQSSFKALVDSQTGRVLETWDRPIFDPVHPSDNFKVKLNPHYHGN